MAIKIKGITVIDDNKNIDANQIYIDAGTKIKVNDDNSYWMATGSSYNWGIYWNTTENQIQFHGDGSSKAYIDLDNGNGTFTGALSSSNMAEASTVSTIAKRNASGDLNCRLLRSEYTSTSANCSYFLTQNAVGTSDNYARPSTVAQVRTKLGQGTYTMGTQQALVANNYGRGVFGYYSATRYQHVWSMGTAYKGSDDGTSYGNMYGLTYTHTNIGTGTNEAISGLSHQLQHRSNGTLTAAIGTGIWTSGDVVAYSDIAVKTNLVRIPNALEKVCAINGYTFERTDYVKDPEDANAPDKRIQAGVVAQEVEKVLPEVVSGEEGNKAVAYGNMVALLIEATKEQQEQIKEQQVQIDKLTERLDNGI